MAPARERITAYAFSTSRKRDPFLRLIPFFGPPFSRRFAAPAGRTVRKPSEFSGAIVLRF
jgi:hypothetical protein